MSPAKPRSSKGARPAKLVVRRARAEDRDAILAMSKGIWGGSDYLPLVWDRWLADDQGILLTATLDGRPVGMAKITILSPGEVWLEGLRLHPSLQGRGLTRQINDVTFREVSKLRPKSVRYSTGAANIVSRHLGERRGFWQVARTHWLWGRTRKSGSIRARLADLGDLDALTDFVKASECHRANGGLFATGWTFPELTRRRLRDLASRGHVLISPRRGRVRGVAIYEIGPIDSDICLGYIDGPDETIASLARDVLRVAGKAGQDEASAMLPVGRIASAVRAAGFDRILPVEAVVYEMGARGLKPVAGSLESVLRRTLRMSQEEVTDLLADLLFERAPAGLDRQNVRDFVARNVVPDTRRQIIGKLQPLLYSLGSWSLRGAFTGIVERLVGGHGIGDDSIRIRKNGVSFWHEGTKVADLRAARKAIVLSLGPGFGPCFRQRLAEGRDWVRFPKGSLDKESGRYSAVVMRLTGETQIADTLKAIDTIMKCAARRR
jgi:hypothetical protein